VIGPGSVFTVGPGSQVIVDQGDVHVLEGGTLRNQGELHVGRDLIVDGQLETLLGGSPESPRHGTVHVAGDAEYHGTLAVALARGAYFQQEQDFTIATYANGFGTLTASELPGANWSSAHRERELVVRLEGRAANEAEHFGIDLDAAFLDGRVLVDWVAHFDQRTALYSVERYNESTQDWMALGEVQRLSGDVAAAYYSTVDDQLPTDQRVARYRIRLDDSQGTWNYSSEVLVDLGVAQQLRVFPNPVTGGQVQLLGVDHERGLTSLRLIGEDGRQLREYPTEPQQRHLLELPGQLVAGTYIVELVYADGVSTAAPLVVVR